MWARNVVVDVLRLSSAERFAEQDFDACACWRNARARPQTEACHVYVVYVVYTSHRVQQRHRYGADSASK